MLDNHPIIKRAVANQYQIILAAAAAALSVATMSPLPLLLLAGGEVLGMPFLLERVQRRLEIEKKYAERQMESLSREERFDQLAPDAKNRYRFFERVCGQIQDNYRGLSTASQAILADHRQKFEAILSSALRRLWLAQKYEQMIRTFDTQRVGANIEKLRGQLQATGVKDRIREAWQQNLAINEKLLDSGERLVTNRTAILAELDSLESLLQLVLQKSLAATDASAFTADIDDILAQTETDAASVQEMEQLMGGLADLPGPSTLAERAGQTLPFGPRGGRQRDG